MPVLFFFLVGGVGWGWRGDGVLQRLSSVKCHYGGRYTISLPSRVAPKPFSLAPACVSGCKTRPERCKDRLQVISI